MKSIELFRWFMPNPNPRGRPYLSSWAMTAEDAAARGALRPDLSTRTVVQVAETPEEEAQLRRRSDTSALGGPAPGSLGDRKGKQ